LTSRRDPWLHPHDRLQPASGQTGLEPAARVKSSSRYKSSTALWISIAWGLLPLTFYLHLGTLPAGLENALLIACFPGWILAIYLCGGVHGEHVHLAAALCAVFTALIAFGAISLLFWFLRRRAA
jgi:hypothetical protein